MAYKGHENITLIEPQDRTPDGIYEINGAWEHIHVFELLVDGQLTVPFQQLPGKESLSIRGRVTETSMGPELFYRFHPGTGGMTFVFYDVNTANPPMPVGRQYQNEFSEIPYVVNDTPIPLEPGTYYFHVLNIEGAENAYKIGFVLGSNVFDDNDPCSIFN